MFQIPDGIEPAIEKTCELGHRYLAMNESDECEHCNWIAEHAEKVAHQLLKGSGLPEKFAFASIADFKAEHEGQQKALNFALRVMRGDLPAGGFMLGDVGTGKTMLAAGMVNDFRRQRRGVSSYITAIRLIRMIKDGFNDNKSEQQLIDGFIKPNLLVIDEMGAGSGSDFEINSISEIICERHAVNKPTVLISNLQIEEMKLILDSRAIDRFRDGGALVKFEWPSYRGK